MEQAILDITREAVMTTIKVSAPMLLVALIVGLLVSILQTAASIQEQTLAIIPKILAVLISLVVFGSWMIHTTMQMFTHMFNQITQLL